ncbi:MAG: malate dehydrogenase, partial [Pseudomonadales bacterium]
QPVPQAVLDACGCDHLEFGRDYIIPKPMDARLLSQVADAVARAAIETGVARLDYPEHYPLKTPY